ncbi:PEP-utilizing enzyme [Pseudonocardia sp.]|uniref:PEP-utilizing enzyme n=1 Tax=Pseudonocardia sp. TaxID=60912 RepID=UPI003D0DA0DE
MAVEFDTPFDAQYPLYTRANAGEVFPEVLTPLAWSLLGGSIERGFRDAYCRRLGVFPEPDRPWLTVGRFAGRLHVNLSVVRTVADRLPGLDAAVDDRVLLGEPDGGGLPAHVRDPDDARWRRRGLSPSVRTTASATRWARGSAARVRAQAARTDGFLAQRPSSAVLVTRLDELCDRFYRELVGVYATVRALTTAPLTLACRALVRTGLSPAEAMERITAVRGLEGARPSRELAAIARTVEPGSPLAAALAERTSWSALRVSPLAGAAALRGRLEVFLDEFGHHGVNEFDPTAPVWEQRPDQVLTLLRPMVSARPDPPSADPGRGSGLVADALVRVARSAMLRVEVSRTALVLHTHQIRRVFFELAQRWWDRIDIDDLRMLTLAELRGVANGARMPLEVIARRREEIAWARSVEPALWSWRRLAFAPGAPTGAELMTGVGGSVGRARGRVRVLTGPYEEVPDGSVLVSRITGMAWTPLFVTAAAVVTDVGGLLSHATIVARDLGVPAVVDTRVATAELRDGDLVEVDGGAGTVRVLQRVVAH